MMAGIPNTMEVFYETLAAAQQAASIGDLIVVDRNLELLAGRTDPTLPRDQEVANFCQDIMADALAAYRGQPKADEQIAAQYATKYQIINP